MNKFKLLGLTLAFLTPLLTQPAYAEMLVLGTAAGGKTVTLDTNSIPRFPRGLSVGTNATYYLGNERLVAEINCSQKYWRIDGESGQYRPQSQATQNLLSLACSIRRIDDQAEDTGYLLVYDPPSNVRSAPGGGIKCVIDTMQVIKVYPELIQGGFNTDACGGGWISQSQVRPLR
jgi:hypothetical protein